VTRSVALAVKLTGVAAPVASTVMFTGIVSAGGVLSVTVTSKRAVALRPCASVAVQLTGVVPSGKPKPDAGVQTGAIGPVTRSVALAVKLTGVIAPVASTVMFAGIVSAGGVLSVTVTSKRAVALRPCASVAVQLTGVVPSGKPKPDAGVQTGAIGPVTRSVALAVKLTGVAAPVASTVMFTGIVSAGGVLSVTVTSKRGGPR